MEEITLTAAKVRGSVRNELGLLHVAGIVHPRRVSTVCQVILEQSVVEFRCPRLELSFRVVLLFLFRAWSPLR